MATATSRRAPAAKKILEQRRTLAEELLGIHRKHAAVFARMDAIEAELKTIATGAGDSFKEILPQLGEVSVAPGKDAEFKGDLPEIQTEAWRALPPVEAKKLVKSGLIKIVPVWGKKSSGRVTVKVFEGASK